MENQKIEQLHFGPDNRRIQRDQILSTIGRYWYDVRTRLEKSLEEHNVCDSINNTVKYLRSRPFLLASVIVVLSAITLPVVFFTLFAVTTAACTFTGFVLIEGTILAFGILILCGVLFSIVTSILILGACLALAYYMYLQICAVIKKI